MNSVIYDFQFGFRQKYSTSDALMYLTDKIREQLEVGNFARRIFVDLQKAFDTVDHDIVIQKLNHCGIRGVAHYWLSSYFQNRLQYVSINGFNSNLEHIYCGISQGSILGPLSFLIYVNNINRAIRYCSAHHFSDDTDLLNYNNSIKRMNKQVKQDLKKLTNWMNANKICLSISKTEVVLFKSSRKLTDVPKKTET